MGVMSLTAMALALAAPNAAPNKCQVVRMVEFPVTMMGRRPMVAAKFGDRDARFIIDSGAFYSTISTASAAEFGLKVTPAPSYFHLRGIGGDASAGIAVAGDFSLAGVNIPKANFIVGGSDTGTAGLIGQNILGLADTEYDLPHGAVRLMKTAHCAHVGLAYWAGDKPFTAVPLEGEPDGLFKPHTIGTILLDGVKIRAVFDSGAEASVLSLAAAKRVGVTPDSPGVVAAASGSGLGSRRVPSWIATFDKIDIGGEAIAHPRIRISPIDLQNADMLIGADFFLTHRMFVSNATRMLYITYEGGPVFGLSPRGARTADGEALDLTDKAAEPTTADAFARRGAVLASNRRFAEALADLDKAVGLAPDDARYAYQRAMVRLAAGQRAGGQADLDRTIGLAPNDADARLARAGFRLRGNDHDGALADIKAADAVLAPSSDKRLALASLYDRAGVPAAALNNYDLWLRSHPEDSSRSSALNGRCWTRALLDRDLDKALGDCDAAIKLQPRNGAYLDSRALVRLRRGELTEALADYDAAIRLAPRNAWSLWARSIVELKMGKADQAKADRQAALQIEPKIADRARLYGLGD